MDFYNDIVHRLYVNNTRIGETFFSNPFEFIEAMHERADFKGKVYYQNLLMHLPNNFGANMRPEFFRELVNYCSEKINGKTPNVLTESKVQQKVLSQNEVALICFYLGRSVAKENEQDIAKEFAAKGKGKGIYQDYVKWTNKNERQGHDTYKDGDSDRKDQNKVKLFERVIEWLKTNSYKEESKKAETELTAFKKKKELK